MPHVLITAGGRTARQELEPGATLLSGLRAAGIDASFPCAGNHTCGKCRVFADGALSAPGPEELRLLGEAYGRGMRLACFARAEGDCALTLPDGAGIRNIAVDHAGFDGPLSPIYSGAYGAAIDIGTTTVVGYLFSKDDAKPLAVLGEMNRQQAYGADVLSRILYCNEHGTGALSALICGQLSELLTRLCQTAGVPASALSGLCVTGNTTMLHILTGLSPGNLALAPFVPESLFGETRVLALPDFPHLPAYLPPCVSAYVGADITCSMLASGIVRRADTTLLVDIGTNGEMALKTPGRLVCCSTAAGPAFEGAGISQGVGARAGAIDKVWIENGALMYSTIDHAPAVGICGSGLLDAVNAMTALGWINARGRVLPTFAGAGVPIGASGVSVTQADVRALQLAKGAIRAGMDTLLAECGVTCDELTQIILCGGFGSFLNPVSAAGIGLLPEDCADRTVAIGNAAGAGAGRILQSVFQQGDAADIAWAAETIELSFSPGFTKRYFGAMAFPTARERRNEP